MLCCSGGGISYFLSVSDEPGMPPAGNNVNFR